MGRPLSPRPPTRTRWSTAARRPPERVGASRAPAFGAGMARTTASAWRAAVARPGQAQVPLITVPAQSVDPSCPSEAPPSRPTTGHQTVSQACRSLSEGPKDRPGEATGCFGRAGGGSVAPGAASAAKVSDGGRGRRGGAGPGHRRRAQVAHQAAGLLGRRHQRGEGCCGTQMVHISGIDAADQGIDQPLDDCSSQPFAHDVTDGTIAGHPLGSPGTHQVPRHAAQLGPAEDSRADQRPPIGSGPRGSTLRGAP